MRLNIMALLKSVRQVAKSYAASDSFKMVKNGFVLPGERLKQ